MILSLITKKSQFHTMQQFVDINPIKNSVYKTQVHKNPGCVVLNISSITRRVISVVPFVGRQNQLG